MEDCRQWSRVSANKRKDGILSFVFAFLLIPAFVQAAVGDRLVQTSVKADVAAIVPSEVFHVGVLLHISPGWHIYWKSPGDSGLATTVKLDLPPGFTAGQVEYPFPTRILLPGDIVNNAYEGETMLIVPVTAPKDLAIGTAVTISAKVKWLVCKEICAPGTATVTLQLPVAAESSPAKPELFGDWARRIPLAHDPEHVVDVSTVRDLKQGASGLAGSAETVIQWRGAVTDIAWFADPPRGVAVSNIVISNEKKTTKISYHVDIAPDAGNNHGVESVVVYTIPGGRRMSLTIPGSGK
jgi:DsbC/DsbD-like thiol-disulfide interchange protein